MGVKVSKLEVQSIRMKKCKKCQEVKDKKDFQPKQCYCKSCKNIIARELYNPKIAKGYALKRFWPGSTATEAQANYNLLLLQQNGKCSICARHQSEFNRALCVDHNHKTGKVRGLLCNMCNQAYGLLKESTQAIENLFNYHKERN